jgi:hypothetical protein
MLDPNRRRHIFGEPRHNLDGLARHYGGEEAAGRAIVEAVANAYSTGNLAVDDDGLFKQVFEIGGNSVTVSGRVVDGVARVATAWIPR